MFPRVKLEKRKKKKIYKKAGIKFTICGYKMNNE